MLFSLLEVAARLRDCLDWTLKGSRAVAYLLVVGEVHYLQARARLLCEGSALFVLNEASSHAAVGINWHRIIPNEILLCYIVRLQTEALFIAFPQFCLRIKSLLTDGFVQDYVDLLEAKYNDYRRESSKSITTLLRANTTQYA